MTTIVMTYGFIGYAQRLVKRCLRSILLCLRTQQQARKNPKAHDGVDGKRYLLPSASRSKEIQIPNANANVNAVAVDSESSSNACTTAPRVPGANKSPVGCGVTAPARKRRLWQFTWTVTNSHLIIGVVITEFAASLAHPRPRLWCCGRFLCFVLLSAFHSRISVLVYRLLPVLFYSILILGSHRIAPGLHLSPRISHTVLKHLARQSFISLAAGRVTCPTKPLDSPTTSAQQQ
jgi:hypothetical protein